MTRLTLTAALAVALAAPAFAQSQLERSLGVEPGVYTVQELALMNAKQGAEGDEALMYFGEGLATRGVSRSVINDVEARFAAESDDGGERGRAIGVSSDPNGDVFDLAFDSLESLD